MIKSLSPGLTLAVEAPITAQTNLVILPIIGQKRSCQRHKAAHQA